MFRQLLGNQASLLGEREVFGLGFLKDDHA